MKMKSGILLCILCAGIAWTQTTTLTMDECVATALQQNPQVVQGEFYYKMAERDVMISLSNFLPDVSASLGYNHSVVGPSSFVRIDPQTGIEIKERTAETYDFASSAGLSVSQTLFSGGYNYFNYRSANDQKNSSMHQFESIRQQIIYLVKERYYNLLKAQKLLEVQEESLKYAEESYKRAQVLNEVGKVPKSDVLQAKVQLEESRLLLIEAQNGLSIARASLNHVLGFDVEKEIQVVDNLDAPEKWEIPYEEAVQSSIQFNPSLLKSISDVKGSRAGIGMAVSRYMPQVSAFYSYSWRNKFLKNIDEIRDQDYNWYAGVRLSLPLFEGFSKIAQLSKAKLNYKYSQEALEQTHKDIGLEVKQSYFNMQQAERKISVTQDGEEAAGENLRLNQEKYNLGAGTMLDLINSQVNYTQARSNRIQALYDLKLSVARLQKAMGKLEK